MLFRSWLVDAEDVPSTDVDVTVSVKSSSLLDGGVIVRLDSCAGVSVHTPPPAFEPADSTAPVGTPEIVTETVSVGSVAEVEIDSAIAVSSLPNAGLTARFGVSATGFTVTRSVWLVDAEDVPSTDVDVTVKIGRAHV